MMHKEGTENEEKNSSKIRYWTYEEYKAFKKIGRAHV